MHDDDYTSEPNHVRVYVEEWPEGTTFTIDGADDEGRYTEGVWSGYPDLETALRDVPAFVKATTLDGVKWRWDTDRPRGIRRAPRYGQEN